MIHVMLYAWGLWQWIQVLVMLHDMYFALTLYLEERRYVFHPYHGARYWDCLLYTRDLWRSK